MTNTHTEVRESWEDRFDKLFVRERAPGVAMEHVNCYAISLKDFITDEIDKARLDRDGEWKKKVHEATCEINGSKIHRTTLEGVQEATLIKVRHKLLPKEHHDQQ